MNRPLKDRHFGFITSENARDIYERLAAACEKRAGGCDDACLLLIADYCRNEQLKEMLQRKLVKLKSTSMKNLAVEQMNSMLQIVDVFVPLSSWMKPRFRSSIQ